MSFIPIAKKDMVELTGLRGLPVALRPAMIVSVVPGPPTKVETIDGVVNLVRETPEEIGAMLARGGRRLLAGGASYAGLKEAIDSDDLDSFITGDDGKAVWIEALKEVAYGRPRSKLLRLLGIYGELLSPFAFFMAFSPGFKKGAPSPLEAEMLAKGFAKESSGRGIERRHA